MLFRGQGTNPDIARSDKFAVQGKSLPQYAHIFWARYLNGAECSEMVGDVLGVKKTETSLVQSLHKLNESNLGGIGNPMKH